MGTLIALIGIIAGTVFVVINAIRVLRGKSAKPTIIAFSACFVMIIVGSILPGEKALTSRQEQVEFTENAASVKAMPESDEDGEEPDPPVEAELEELYKAPDEPTVETPTEAVAAEPTSEPGPPPALHPTLPPDPTPRETPVNANEESGIPRDLSSAASGGESNFYLYHDDSKRESEFMYILNTHTMKIHHPYCSSVADIKPENYEETNLSLEELLSMGYTMCGKNEENW